MIEKMTADIVEALVSSRNQVKIREFDFAIDRENELLCFLKPECFLSNDPKLAKRLVSMVLKKFAQYGASVSGALLLGGNCLNKAGIMDRHYGFINTLSKNASKSLASDQVRRVQSAVDIDDSHNYRILGGHEFLREFATYTEDSLDSLWLGKKSIKLQGGFYVQKYLVNGNGVVLVNGFHPAQLKWYTDPGHKIVVLLLHGDTPWKALRNDMIGDTFPEKATPESIRGEIFKNGSDYGIDKVAVSTNCIHLSAGPFEGLFEINNFLSALGDFAFDLKQCNMYRKMAKKGLDEEMIRASMKNPQAKINGAKRDLFAFTEDTNSAKAVAGYIEYFRGYS